MNHQWELPSGRGRGVPMLLPDNWSVEQALAVVELLDDLREQIWHHYEVALFERMREERQISMDFGGEEITDELF